jgi:predicted esterase
LDLSIYIFHGKSDGYCDVNDVYEIRDTFKRLGKTNLSVNVFEKHGHGLEMDEDTKKHKGISPGREMLLDVVKNLEDRK